jgi:hypothetical protein
MIHPLQLPSGKIIDISKCVAIIPNSTSVDSEVVLSGTEHQMYIDATDLETLRAAIIKQSSDRPKYVFELRTSVADLQRREQVGEWMEAFRREKANLATEPDADKSFEVFAKIVDAERPNGQKLYSAE